MSRTTLFTLIVKQEFEVWDDAANGKYHEVQRCFRMLNFQNWSKTSFSLAMSIRNAKIETSTIDSTANVHSVVGKFYIGMNWNKWSQVERIRSLLPESSKLVKRLATCDVFVWIYIKLFMFFYNRSGWVSLTKIDNEESYCFSALELKSAMS